METGPLRARPLRTGPLRTRPLRPGPLRPVPVEAVPIEAVPVESAPRVAQPALAALFAFGGPRHANDAERPAEREVVVLPPVLRRLQAVGLGDIHRTARPTGD